MTTRIDYSEISSRCWRTDHNQGRLINGRRELAHEKHGDKSIEAIPQGDHASWLAVLMEEVGEVGEVGHALTYDAGQTLGDLADELLDVMAVCGAWLDALREVGVTPDPKGTWLAS